MMIITVIIIIIIIMIIIMIIMIISVKMLSTSCGDPASLLTVSCVSPSLKKQRRSKETQSEKNQSGQKYPEASTKYKPGKPGNLPKRMTNQSIV